MPWAGAIPEAPEHRERSTTMEHLGVRGAGGDIVQTSVKLGPLRRLPWGGPARRCHESVPGLFGERSRS